MTAAGYFVTGTDTGVGKTLVACALLHAFANAGCRVVGMKPVAAGCSAGGCEDVIQLRAAGNVAAAAASVNPYAFASAIAPHVAARQAGVMIDLERIRQAYADLRGQADVVIVEGVGGFRVPLNAREDSADLAVLLGLPLVLVVGMRLGCLNHTLLSAEAIAARGLRLAGWVANCVQPQMEAFEDNLAALRERLPAPLLGVLPHLAEPRPARLAPLLAVGRLAAP